MYGWHLAGISFQLLTHFYNKFNQNTTNLIKTKRLNVISQLINMNEFLPSTSKQTSIIERFGGIEFVITDIDLNHNILKPRKDIS
ncbi:hypothetical protein BpHYR1_003467 [Brachionus plicatilis]|uniref:Uncharacterized protein n=1 Tax=Brachionus plicatilis TaxID=10195 RepID=A0A3M7SK10_BRAPC|nr:hypothetical protein BpHYR1_003467 [Brachionus plicatilis]